MAKTLGASLVLALLVMVIFLNGTTLAAGRGYPVNDAGGQVYQLDDCFIFGCFGQIPHEIGNCAELIHTFIVNPLLLVMVIIYRSSQSMKGSGRIGQGILIISFMLLFVQSHGQFQFDYFKLALQWTPTTCAVSTCNQTKFSQFPQEFTIHGLWPSTYAYPQPNWCQPRLLYDTNNTQFIPLKNQLNANWPDMIKPTNDIFWGHEFEKHGTCMTSNQADYFITTLNLKSQLIPNVKAAIGYAPSRMTRNIQDFMTSLIRAYGFQPVIVCKRNRRNALAEVWLCFDNNRRLRNCPQPWKIDCNTFISLLA